MSTTTAPALDPALLGRAFDGISWSPERHQAATRREFAAEIANFAAEAEGLPDAEALTARFQAGLAARYNAWLAKMGRCMSWAIAGPARFPVRKAEAANNAERAEREKMQEWIEYQLKRIRKAKAKAEGRAPIMASDPDAPEQLRNKIAHLVALHELELAYNRARRKGVDAAGEWMKATIPGQPERIKADFQKRFKFYDAHHPGGFPSYHFQLENANIKRLRDRLERIEKQREICDKMPDTVTPDGVRIEWDGEANRVRLHYPDKPDAETRQLLKSNGFRWSPRAGAWQAFINRRTEIFIEKHFNA